MKAIQESYSLYSTQEYRKRVLIAVAIWTLVTKESVLGAAIRYCNARDKDLTEEIIRKIRGFSATEVDFLAKFRKKPCTALLAMICHRTANFTATDLQARIANYHKMTKALTERGYFVPGWARLNDRSFWQYPIPVPNQGQFYDFCNANGVFCSQASSQITVVPAPDYVKRRNSDYRGNPNCIRCFSNIVYLPVHNRIAPKTMDLLVRRTVDIHDRYYQYIGQLGKRETEVPLACARPKL